MATSSEQANQQTVAGRQVRIAYFRFDRLFFSGMAAAILLSVLIGFAESYYLQGVAHNPHWRAFNTPPYPLLVHLHGLIFSLWILLLITQTSLVAANRLRLHRKLGIVGFILAFLLVLLGVAIVCESMARHVPIGHPSIGGQSVALLNIFGFAVLAYLGYRQRRNPPAHKRLMIVATISLLPAAFSRWPILHDGTHLRAAACCFVLAALIACYDIWSAAKVYPATLLGAAVLLLTNPPIVETLIHNSMWFRLSLPLQSVGRYLH
jgi:hypothetical protein